MFAQFIFSIFFLKKRGRINFFMQVNKRTTDAWQSKKPDGLYHLPAMLTTNETDDATTRLDKFVWRPRFTRAGPKARNNGAHMFAPGIREQIGADLNQRMIVATDTQLFAALEKMVANAKCKFPKDSFVQAFRAESLACMRYLKKWDLGFHFDYKVEEEEAGIVFMACFGDPGLERIFRFVNPFNKTKWDLITRPGDLVIFHSECYQWMHGSLPLECDGPFYSVTMRRSDGCGYIMGGKRGSSALAGAAAKRFKQCKRDSSGVADEAATKRFKHSEPDCVAGNTDYEHKIEQHEAEETKAADATLTK